MRVNIFWLFLVVVLGFAAVSGCATWRAEHRAPMIGTLVGEEGRQLHVVDIGPRASAKSPVVLIHGASVNLRDMKMSLGDPLSGDRRVIMLDRPGRGYSDRPEDGYRLSVQARHIHDAVSSLGIEKPIVVGQSFGGAVALSYALQYQEEMAGLVLLAPVSHEWPGGVVWYNRVSETPVAGFLLRRFVIPVYGLLSAEGGIRESFAPDEAPPDYFERSGLSLLFRPRDFRSNASDIVHLKQQIIEQQDRYGELDIPVSIVTGIADPTVSPELHSMALREQIADAELTLLPDTGHALHHSQTARILAAIEALSGAQ